MPANYPLELYRGDTYQWQFRFWQDEAKTLPSDLTGVVATSEVRSKDKQESLIATMACVITLPNIIDVTLTTAESQKLVATINGEQWDLQLLYAGGVVWTPVAGPVKVKADATK